MSCPAFAVVASYEPSRPYIRHVGLLATASDLELDDKPPVCDMGPPLRLGEMLAGAQSPQAMKVEVVGWIDSLPSDSDRMGRLFDWIANMRTRFAGRIPPIPSSPSGWGPFIRDSHYVIYPAYKRQKVVDPQTGVSTLEYFFSCVGFIMACYSEGADINLVADPESGSVPLAGMTTISAVFGQAEAWIIQRQKKSLQIESNGPWPIIFGGYILHSLESYPHREATQPHNPRFIEIKF